MQTRYDRACEDIDKFSTHNSDLIKLSDKQRGVISELSTNKAKLETDLEFHQNQIKHHLRENDKKQRKINDYEGSITTLESDTASLNEELSLIKIKMKQADAEVSNKDTLLKGLKYERGRLEDALRDYKKQNEVYQKRYEDTKKLYEEIREKYQEIQREELSFNSLNLNFNKRVEEMDQANQKLEEKILQLEKDLETQDSRNKILNEQNDTLIAANEEITKEIQEINKLK